MAPVPIEDRLKQKLPVIGGAMLVGDQKKFLSILIALKTELNTETLAATNRLTPVVRYSTFSLQSSAAMHFDNNSAIII